MELTAAKTMATVIVAKLKADLMDRQGQVWGAINKDTQAQILARWHVIVLATLAQQP